MKNLSFFAVLAALLVGAEALLIQGSHHLVLLLLVINFVVALSVAFVGHRSVMLGEQFKPRDLASIRVLPSKAFIRTSVPFFMLTVAVYASIGWMAYGEAFLGGDALPILVIFPVFLIGLFNFYFLGRFGSALPAAAIGTDASLSRAARRSYGRRWLLIQDILVGPALFGWLTNKVFVMWDGLDLPTGIWNHFGTFSAIGAVMSYLGQLSGIFVLLLLVSVLCEAYRSGEAILEREHP